MTIYDLKPKFQSLLRPLVKKLFLQGKTPNDITLLAIYLSFFGGLSVFFTYVTQNYLILILVPFIMFIRMALNAIDGMLAKEHGMMTKEGAVLNEMGDVISDVFLYLPFALLINPMIVIVFVILSVLSEFIGVLGQAIYLDRRYDGPMGKSDRAFIIGLSSLILVYNDNFVWTINILLSICIIGLLLTVYNRWKKLIINNKGK